jgi:hypothetical protein
MGTLPLGKANAAAICVPFMDEFIVVFHHGLFAFVNLLAKVVAAAIPSDGSTEPATFRYEIEEIEERMKDNPVILERFIDALTSYLLDGRPRTRPVCIGTAKPYVVRDIGAISRIFRSRP